MIDLEELKEMVEQGYVRKVVHPGGELELFNYTEKCTYEGVWNHTTRQCRGLILDLPGKIVARPFRKFFNYGEGHAPDLDLDAPVIVTDKMDGSLGILYWDGVGWSVATRGSFTSDQAIHATKVWDERYSLLFEPPAGSTCTFEILYPANRIVVDYGELDDLVLLACLDNETGGLRHDHNWPGPATTEYAYATLREALEAEPRPGQEGLVVYFPDSGERVKLKQEDYIAIHRLVFGLTARRIWENAGVHDLLGSRGTDVAGVIRAQGAGMEPKQIGITLQMDPKDVRGIIDAAPDGDWMAEMLQIVPEEFAAWAIQTAKQIIGEVDTWETTVLFRMIELTKDLEHPFDRKLLAGRIKEEPKEIQAALFYKIDHKSIRSFAWRAVRPEHETFKPVEETE